MGNIFDDMKLRDKRLAKAIAKMEAANGAAPMPANLIKAMDWLREKKGGVRFNEMMSHTEISGREARDVDIAYLRIEALRKGLKISKQTMQDVVEAVAHECSYDPLKDYLTGLRWDGVARLESLLCDALGAPQGLYTSEIGTRFMVGAIARALNPGCQHRHIMVLSGPEDIGKSLFCRDLSPVEEWWSDSLPTDLHSQAASEAVLGKWIIESAELASIKRSEHEAVKAFISRAVENFRPAYGHYPITYKRRCVVIGTTNEEDFVPARGEWTRIWPVRATGYEREYLLGMRDQLWAEAVKLYRDGMKWWRLPDDVKREAHDARQEMVERESWEEMLEDMVGLPSDIPKYTEMTDMKMVAEKREIHACNLNKSSETRIGIAMKRLGWERIRIRCGGRLVYRWYRVQASR
jgi:predicted P-loop ATPase